MQTSVAELLFDRGCEKSKDHFVFQGRKVNGIYFVQCMKYCSQFKVALKEKMFWINVNITHHI